MNNNLTNQQQKVIEIINNWYARDGFSLTLITYIKKLVEKKDIPILIEVLQNYHLQTEIFSGNKIMLPADVLLDKNFYMEHRKFSCQFMLKHAGNYTKEDFKKLADKYFNKSLWNFTDFEQLLEIAEAAPNAPKEEIINFILEQCPYGRCFIECMLEVENAPLKELAIALLNCEDKYNYTNYSDLIEELCEKFTKENIKDILQILANSLVEDGISTYLHDLYNSKNKDLVSIDDYIKVFAKRNENYLFEMAKDFQGTETLDKIVDAFIENDNSNYCFLLSELKGVSFSKISNLMLNSNSPGRILDFAVKHFNEVDLSVYGKKIAELKNYETILRMAEEFPKLADDMAEAMLGSNRADLLAKFLVIVETSKKHELQNALLKTGNSKGISYYIYYTKDTDVPLEMFNYVETIDIKSYCRRVGDEAELRVVSYLVEELLKINDVQIFYLKYDKLQTLKYVLSLDEWYPDLVQKIEDKNNSMKEARAKELEKQAKAKQEQIKQRKKEEKTKRNHEMLYLDRYLAGEDDGVDCIQI